MCSPYYIIYSNSRQQHFLSGRFLLIIDNMEKKMGYLAFVSVLLTFS